MCCVELSVQILRKLMFAPKKVYPLDEIGYVKIQGSIDYKITVDRCNSNIQMRTIRMVLKCVLDDF